MRKFWFVLLILFIISPLVANCESAGAFYDFKLESNSSIPSNSFSIDDFMIDWDNEKGQLTVYNQAEPTRAIWQTILQKGFCGAAKGIEKITEKSGSFTIKDKKSFITDFQKVTSISNINKEVSIIGDLISGSKSIQFSLVFSIKSKNQLHVILTTNDPTYNRLYLSYSCGNNEQFFGFGEQPSRFNHKGKRVPILIQEQGIGRGDKIVQDPITNALLGLTLGNSKGDDYSTYKSIPHYISSKSNSLYLENYEYAEFDFTKNNQIQIEVYSNRLEANIIYARNPLDAIEEYTIYSGRMHKLPDWILEGAVIGMQGGTQKVYDVLQTLQKVGTPISAFWLQDWIGQRTTFVGKQLWWNWELDTLQYPKWNYLLDSLQNEGIHVLGYINPFIVNVQGEKINFKRNLYQEALEKDFLIKNSEGAPYMIQNTSFSSAILDLSDSNCVRWIKDIIKDEMIGKGLRGWMADFAEAMPFDIELKNGESPETYHNKYAEEWVRINREAIDEAGYSDSIVFFARSGSAKSPKYASLFWQGDQVVNWGKNDGIKSAVTGLLGAGLSGFSFNHSDIGGYTSIGALGVILLQRSQELLFRWMEMSAFTTVFRTHEGLGPDKNYQVYQDSVTAKHFARNAKIYVAWNFYRKQLVQEAHEKGWPVCRHMFLEFPSDANTYNLSFEQFMVGSELLIAPVLYPGSSSVEVYLPAGNWVDVWTQKVYNSLGQKYTIYNLKNKAAVFYPHGSKVGEQFKQNLNLAEIF